jgi:lincosamide nucleotidyltransferase A/C/D/E
MVSAEDAVNIYRSLSANNIQVWLSGGWGIDALLREQTRPHKDLDIILLLDDVVDMRALLERDGYCLKELWSENSWAVDAHGIETPTAFVLQDAEGREVDVHAIRLDDRGDGTPAWAGDEGLVIKKDDLAGDGIIAGFAVCCFSPEMQVVCHTGYDLPSVQLRDLGLLHEKFGVEYPDTTSCSRQSRA